MAVSDLDSPRAGNDHIPLLSIGMPIYNAGKYLRIAVLSIIDQTFADWELLIIDDGSTDNAILSISDLLESRIKVLRDGENRGLAVRLNECIDMAKGQYFARMDQDDVSYPNRFIRQITSLQEDLSLDLVSVRSITIDEENNGLSLFPASFGHARICARPWQGFYLAHPTWMGRIEWFRKHRYTEPGPYFCEDQELLLRSYQDSRFETLNEILFAYRIRKTVNFRKLARTRITLLRIQCQYFYQQRLVKYYGLAIMAYTARSILDLANKIFPATLRKNSTSLDVVVSKDWNVVLKKFESRLS